MARENDLRAKIEAARSRLSDDQEHIHDFSVVIDPESPRSGPKKAPRTVETYTDNLRRFEERAATSLVAMTTEDVLEAVKDLGDELSSDYVGQIQSAIKAFYRWSEDHDVDPEAIAVSTTSEPAIDEQSILSPTEFHAIRDEAEDARARCIIDLFGFTGQRIRVIQTLRVGDVKPDDGPTGRYRLNRDADGLKGADKAMTRRPLLGAKASVRDWLSFHPTMDPDDYLITTRPTTSRGEPGSMVAQNTIRRAIKKAADRAGVDKPVNPHAFRHFFATTAVRDYGMDPDVVRRLLGHGSGSRIMETTYRHLNDDDVIADAEESYPGVELEEGDQQENPLTPPICPTCSRPLDGHKECPQCGELFGPDSDGGPPDELFGQMYKLASAATKGLEGLAKAEGMNPDDMEELKEAKALLEEVGLEAGQLDAELTPADEADS